MYFSIQRWNSELCFCVCACMCVCATSVSHRKLWLWKLPVIFPYHILTICRMRNFSLHCTYRCACSVSTIWKLFHWRTTSTLPSVIRCMYGCIIFLHIFLSVLPLNIMLMLTFTGKSHQLLEHFGCEVTWVLSFRKFQNPFNRATRPNEYSLLISSKSNMIASCFWAFTRLLLYFLPLLPLLFLIFFIALSSFRLASTTTSLFTVHIHNC